MSHSAANKEQLQDAFELFNEFSAQLSSSYQALQQQVVSLTRDLAAASAERQKLLGEIRVLQQEASRGQRLSTMGEMTARLAHQVRTPLATALLYASQLKQTGLRQDQHDCFVDRLLVGLRHLDHMVNDMLLYARGAQCGDDYEGCREDLNLCRDDCEASAREQLRRCRELTGEEPGALRACIASARREALVCARDCRSELSCGTGLADCLEGCAIEP